MSLKGRETLKSFFRQGNLPREGQFADLIDSVVNRIDDGISSSPVDGLKVAQMDHQGKLISFYDGPDTTQAVWSIKLGSGNRVLSITDHRNNEVICFDDQGQMGVGTTRPQSKLDVNGTTTMKGRKGSFTTDEDAKMDTLSVPANGKWHPLLTNLDGCRAFEVVAGTGKRKTGRYALLHAIAMNCFQGSGARINTVNATYRWFWQRLALQWTGSMNDYNLEIKTWMNYGSDVRITCHISSLWHDPYMMENQPDQEQLPEELS